jgi:hypothetical protein
MKKLNEILIHFAENEMTKIQMRQIKGSYGGEGDSCTADCTGKPSVTCDCDEGITCIAQDDAGCNCGIITGEHHSC